MTELILLSNEKLQRSAELARRNIAALKAQKANPLKLSPVVPRTADGRRVAARRKLTEASKATLVHTLGGATLFVKPPAESLIP